MNYLVFLDTQAGELEKILSGTKTIVLLPYDLPRPAGPIVSPGDSLYFIRNNAECALRVQATVVHVRFFAGQQGDDLSQPLKELQPRLQLTENQYNDWSAKTQAMLIEFEAAHKIDVIQVSPCKIKDRSDWIAFEEFSRITD